MKTGKFNKIAKLFPLISEKSEKYYFFNATEIVSANITTLVKDNAIGIYTLRRNIAKDKNNIVLADKFQKIREGLGSVDFENITAVSLQIKEHDDLLHFLIFANTELNKTICSVELELMD